MGAVEVVELRCPPGLEGKHLQVVVGEVKLGKAWEAEEKVWDGYESIPGQLDLHEVGARPLVRVLPTAVRLLDFGQALDAVVGSVQNVEFRKEEYFSWERRQLIVGDVDACDEVGNL